MGEIPDRRGRATFVRLRPVRSMSSSRTTVRLCGASMPIRTIPDADDRHRDIVPDQNFLADLSRKNEHRRDGKSI